MSLESLSEMQINPERVNKSLRFSFFDGVFASGMVGFTQDYFAPFLLLLGGTTRHIGFLSSLPHFAAALIQLKSPDATEKIGSRKKIINSFVFLQAMVLLPMALMAFMKISLPLVFVALVTLFTALGAFSIPPYGFALCAGGLAGGFLSEKLPAVFGYQLLTLFLLSSCLRMGVAVFMPMFLKGVRDVTVVGNRNLFLSVIWLKPLFYDTK